MAPLDIIIRIETLTTGMLIPFAALTFAVCVFNLITIMRSGARAPDKEPATYLPWLAVIFLGAIILRFVLYPHHAGPLNDDLYNAQRARQMLEPAFLPINDFVESTAWPFLVSLFFWFTGPDQYTLYYANSVFGCLSVIVMYFLVYGVTKQSSAGITAAAFLAFFPLHTMWSICGSSIVPSLFFMLSSVAALFWFFRLHHKYFIVLSLYAASFAVQVHAENIVLFVFIPLAMYLLEKELFSVRQIIVNTFLPIVLTLPNVAHQLVIKAGSVAPGSNSIIEYLMENLSAEIARFTSSSGFPLLLFGFAALSLVLGWKKYSKPMILFIVLCSAYLVLFSFNPEYIAYRERFSLFPSIWLIVIGSFLVCAVIDMQPHLRTFAQLAGILIPLGVSVGFHVKNMNPGNDYFIYGKAITETIDKMKTDLPPASVVISEDPAPFQAVTNFNVITPMTALENTGVLSKYNHIYFMMDVSSNNIAPQFFSEFEFALKYPLPVDLPDSDRKLKGGLYRATVRAAIPDSTPGPGM